MVASPFVSEPLTEAHGLAAFESGKPVLDEWLRRSALHAQANRTARTYVWHRGDRVVAAWFSLAASRAHRAELPKRVARGSPEVIPAVLLARLALERSLQGRGLGSQLLLDAATRVVAASELIGARMFLVDAIDEEAVRFFERFGFTRVPAQLRLAQKVSDVAAALGSR